MANFDSHQVFLGYYLGYTVVKDSFGILAYNSSKRLACRSRSLEYVHTLISLNRVYNY